MGKNKDLATTSFVLGLFFWVPLLNVYIAILAILIGAKALYNATKHPKEYGGKKFAIAGIILGFLPVLFSAIGFVQRSFGSI